MKLATASYAAVIYKKYTDVVIRMTKIHFSYIFGLHPWFPAHISQKPCNFTRCENSGNIFAIRFGLLSSVLEIAFEP